jgi:hypothetical protein
VEDTVSAESKQARSVEDGHDFDEVKSEAIDDTIVPMDHLAKRLVTDLG